VNEATPSVGLLSWSVNGRRLPWNLSSVVDDGTCRRWWTTGTNERAPVTVLGQLAEWRR
jgi:hypothetical protein